MVVNIYRAESQIASFKVDDQTVFSYQLMGEQKISANFITTSILPIQIGDYIVWRNENYYINAVPSCIKAGNNYFEYSISFESELYKLYNKKFMDEGAQTFSYYGDASDLIDLILVNINSIDSGWSAGIIDDSDPVLMNFDNVSCRDALTQIAQQFSLEFYLSGKVINLVASAGNDTTIVLEYGKDNGLYQISRKPIDDLNIVTRAYGFGGSKNLDFNYRDGSKQLVFNERFVESNMALYGIREGSIVFDDIYPHRDGTVSDIIADDSMSIIDSSLNFDINAQLLEGVTAQIVFNTGDLGGNQFDIVSYDAASKTIKFKANIDSNNYTLPNDIDKPSINDSYTLVNIKMPQSYIDAAEAELKTRTQTYLDQNCRPRLAYDLVIDRFHAQKNAIAFNAGDKITIIDDSLGVNAKIRAAAISYPIIDPFQISATIADTIPYTVQEKLIAKTVTNTKIIRQVDRTRSEASRVNSLRYRQLQDLVFDPDGYFDATHIKPESIETLMLSVGAKSQNFNLSGVSIISNYGGDANSLLITGGSLIHHEISITGLGYIWVMDQSIYENLNPSKAYYLYAKCSKTKLTGIWEVSDVPKKTEDETGYYLFNLGVLYQVSESRRDFAFTNGMTFINGENITAGRISSLDGFNYFDLTQGVLRASSSDQASGIDVNGIRPGLTIIGGIVQNNGGYTSPLGTDRGPFNPDATYYPGDTTYYSGSTFKYVNPVPKSGSIPSITNTDWKISAMAGSDAPRIIYNSSDDPNSAPILDINNGDLQGWTIGAPGSDIVSLLGLNTGETLVTDSGLSIVLSNAEKWVWMASEIKNADGTFSKWSDPTRMTGRTGVAGAYTDVRWAANGSPTEPPSLVNTDDDPSGWSIAQPTISSTEFLWMTQCNRLGNGVMSTLWSDPVRMEGRDGDPGASLTYRGEWDNGTAYHGTSQLVEAIHYTDGLYYFSRSDAGDIPIGTLPTDTDYWNAFGAQFESVATGLLLAQVAYVEKLIVGMLSTGYDPDDPKARIVAKSGELDVFADGTDYDDESASTAILRLGSSMDNDHAGNPLPGVRIKGIETSPGSGNFDVSLMTGNGALVNGSGIEFTALGAPKRTGSVVGYLRRGNDGEAADGVNPIAAAIVGVDQTDDTTKGNSDNYGGYFNSLFVNGSAKITSLILKSLFLNSVSVSANYSCGDNDFAVMAYNTSGTDITVTMPTVALSSDSDFKGGRLMMFKRANTGGVLLSSDSTHQFFGSGGSSIATSFGMTLGKSMLIAFWDGTYWNIAEI